MGKARTELLAHLAQITPDNMYFVKVVRSKDSKIGDEFVQIVPFFNALEKFLQLEPEKQEKVLNAYVENKQMFAETLDFIRFNGDMKKSTIKNISKELL